MLPFGVCMGVCSIGQSADDRFSTHLALLMPPALQCGWGVGGSTHSSPHRRQQTRAIAAPSSSRVPDPRGRREMDGGYFPSRRETAGLRNALLGLDWVSRHEKLAVVRAGHFPTYLRLLTMMSPDDALGGLEEGLPPRCLFGVIVVRPPSAPKRQLTLEETMERLARRRA